MIADTSLLDRGFERDFLGRWGPSKQMGAYVLDAGRLVISRLDNLAQRLDEPYGAQLDPSARQRLLRARQHLQATVHALTGLPEQLDPHYRGDGH